MSSVRSKRRAVKQERVVEDDEEGPAAAAAAAAAATEGARGRRVKRRRSSAADGGDEGSGGGGRGPSAARAARDAGAAAAAAAAAAGAPRVRQPRLRFSQEEAQRMSDQISLLDAKAQNARGAALELGVAATTLDAIVARVVRHLLFRGHERPGVPVRRGELVDILQKEHKAGRTGVGKRLPALVLAIAAGTLASAFGIELCELNRAAAAGGGGGGGADGAGGGGGGAAQQSYVLRSMLPTALVQRFVHDPSGDPARGLMTVVLALLQLAGGSMEADELWRHLGQLGVRVEDQDNCFGPKGAAEVLAAMERSRYLASSKQAAAGGDGSQQTVYEWGEAASGEFGGRVKELADKWLATPGGVPAGG